MGRLRAKNQRLYASRTRANGSAAPGPLCPLTQLATGEPTQGVMPHAARMTFSPLVTEALGWYVYLLVDPRDDRVFYVGKGRADRAFAHEADALDAADHPELQSAKHERILDIGATGGQVRVMVLRHAIETEKQAYVVESTAIDLVHSMQPGQLLNVVLGHHHAQHGLMTSEEIEVLYAAPAAPKPEVPIMLVSLNRLWTPTITEDDLRDYTTGWWAAGGVNRRKPRYILGVHNGVVRSVYRPVSWRQQRAGDRGWSQAVEGKPPRWGCDAVPAPEMAHWLRTNVKRFLTATQWSIRYIEPNAAEQAERSSEGRPVLAGGPGQSH